MRKQSLFIFLILILFSSGVSAITIGVSPGVVNFNNVLKGGYAEHPVTISTNSPNNITVTYTILGDIKDWITINEKSPFIMSLSSPKEIKIIVRPPKDTQNGNYQARINLMTSGLAEGTNLGSVVRTAVTMIVNIEIVGEEIVACRVAGISISDSEKDYPLELIYTIANDGNVQLSPSVEVDIWNLEELDLLQTEIFKTPSILPTTEQKIRKSFSHNLKIGQYWADILIPECLNKPVKITFDIVEQGTISDDGILIKISNEPWWKVDETIPIIATFKNKGSRMVNAQFKGEITLNGKIIQLLESKELEVLSKETRDFILYFTPNKPGQYQVSGKIYYNKKVTFEKGSIINVNPKDPMIIKFSDIYPIILLFIIVVIITLLILILKKEKKKQNNKNTYRKIYK